MTASNVETSLVRKLFVKHQQTNTQTHKSMELILYNLKLNHIKKKLQNISK